MRRYDGVNISIRRDNEQLLWGIRLRWARSAWVIFSIQRGPSCETAGRVADADGGSELGPAAVPRTFVLKSPEGALPIPVMELNVTSALGGGPKAMLDLVGDRGATASLHSS